MNFIGMIKKPSAFLPLGMSLAALTLVISHIALYGAVREADEGAVAHIFQLLMIAQLPIVGFFAIKWLGRFPKQAIEILAMQACAMLAAWAPVFFLNL